MKTDKFLYSNENFKKEVDKKTKSKTDIEEKKNNTKFFCLSFLAMMNFKPVSDSLFYKE